LAMTAINHETQEGARLFAWSGEATAELVAASPLDLERETNGDVRLVMVVRVDAVPADGEVTLGAGCSEGCTGELPIGDWLASLPRGEWVGTGAALKCLRAAGADTGRIDRPFVLRSGAGLELGLAEVSFGRDVDHELDCPTQ